MKSINNVHIIFIIFVMVFIFVMNRKMKQQKETFFNYAPDLSYINSYINNYQDLKEMDKHMLYINYTDKHEFDGKFGTVDYSNIGQVTYNSNSNNNINVSDKTHLFIGSVILLDGQNINKEEDKIEITIPTDGNKNIKIIKNLKDIEVDIRNNKNEDGTEITNHKGIFFKKILHIDIKEHLNNKNATLSDTPNVNVEILNNNNEFINIEKINYVQVNTDDNIVEKMSELIAFNYRVLMHKFQILINYFRCRDDGVEKIGEGDENSCNLANNNFTQHDLDARLFEALKKPIEMGEKLNSNETKPADIPNIIYGLLANIDDPNSQLTGADLVPHAGELDKIKLFLGKL